MNSRRLRRLIRMRSHPFEDCVAVHHTRKASRSVVCDRCWETDDCQCQRQNQINGTTDRPHAASLA
jgi:hypothetical protein